MRQRECESSISLEYLKSLHSAYEEFIQDISRIIPVIRVNYERFRTADEMAEMIVREYAKMTSVRYIDFDSPAKVHHKPRSTIRSKPELIETEPVH